MKSSPSEDRGRKIHSRTFPKGKRKLASGRRLVSRHELPSSPARRALFAVVDAVNWARSNPDKVAAHRAVARALRAGLIRRLPCEVCGRRRGVQAHHDDYRRPLDVRWLCGTHHRAHHASESRKDVT